MKHERDTLPSHHQTVLEQRLKEITSQESRLHAREASLQAAEATGRAYQTAAVAGH